MKAHHGNCTSKLLQVIPGNCLRLSIGGRYISVSGVGFVIAKASAQNMVYGHHSLAKSPVTYDYAPALFAELTMQLQLQWAWCVGDLNG
jgi:hypothetical protein